MTEPLIVSCHAVEGNPKHVRFRVFNRGGLSGVLIVNTEDAAFFAKQLGSTPDQLDALAMMIKFSQDNQAAGV